MGYTKDDYRNAGFDINQVMYVDYALRNGISADVLELFIDITKPRKFSAAQIEQIVIGLTRNLTTDQVGAYAKPKYNSKAMAYAIAAFEKNSSQEVFDLINSGKYKSEQLIQIIAVILDGQDFNLMLRRDLNGSQLKVIRRGLNKKLTDDQIAIYADPKYSAEQMQAILTGLVKKADTSWYADVDFDPRQMDLILAGLLDNLDVSWYADPAFSSDQMFYLEKLLEAKMPESDIAKLAYPKVPAEALREIMVMFNHDNINTVDIYKKYKFDSAAVKNSNEFKLILPQLSDWVRYVLNV